jgi:glycosyltransferase involved in cell wall biosynthesis
MGKHILFIVENLTYPFDPRVYAEAIAATDFGYEVSVISPANDQYPLKYEKIDGIEVYRHSSFSQGAGKFSFILEYFNALLWELFLAIKIYRKKPFDLIHSANPPDHIFIIAALFKFFSVKYVFDHHDLSPERYVVIFERKDLFYKILLLMEQLTFRFADVVISTNESYKKIALKRGNKKENTVFIVRNGPRLKDIVWMPPNESIKNGFKYLVVYLGVISYQERLDLLLEAASYMVYKKNIRDVKFMIVGKGPNLKELIQLSKEMRLDNYVTFTGFISYENLYEILATADVCLNPEPKNAYTDKSTMWKIMDYMAFGKPIVQFETKEGRVTAGGAALYVRDNNFVAFSEAVIDLINNPEKRYKMGEIGRERIEKKLNWDYQKDALARAYRQVLI